MLTIRIKKRKTENSNADLTGRKFSKTTKHLLWLTISAQLILIYPLRYAVNSSNRWQTGLSTLPYPLQKPLASSGIVLSWRNTSQLQLDTANIESESLVFCYCHSLPHTKAPTEVSWSSLASEMQWLKTRLIKLKSWKCAAGQVILETLLHANQFAFLVFEMGVSFRSLKTLMIKYLKQFWPMITAL